MDMEFVLLRGVERINVKQLLCINADSFPSKHQVLFFVLREVLMKKGSSRESPFHCYP